MLDQTTVLSYKKALAWAILHWESFSPAQHSWIDKVLLKLLRFEDAAILSKFSKDILEALASQERAKGFPHIRDLKEIANV